MTEFVSWTGGSRGSRADGGLCFYFAAVLATRIFWDLQCFGSVPVFFQPLEWQTCMQVCSSGGREVDCVCRRALPVKGCTAQARSESGWQNSFDFWGAQVVSRSGMAAWLPVQRAWTVGLGLAGPAGPTEALPEEAKAGARVEAESVFSDMRLAKIQLHTRIRLVR